MLNYARPMPKVSLTQFQLQVLKEKDSLSRMIESLREEASNTTKDDHYVQTSSSPSAISSIMSQLLLQPSPIPLASKFVVAPLTPTYPPLYGTFETLMTSWQS